MTRTMWLLGFVGLGLGLLAGTSGCDSDDGGNGTDTGTDTGTSTGTGGIGGNTGTAGGGAVGGSMGGGSPYDCTPEDVPCRTEVTSDMDLQDETAPGLIANTADGDGWASGIDASAGGVFAPDPHSYVYARFTETGLDKVLIGDMDSLDSMDWDIAFRRYVIRINSGHSGPSCVSRARLATGTDYDAVTTVDSGLTFAEDEYFSGTCQLIEDGTGMGAPATAMSGFWTYAQGPVGHCIKMEDTVYVVQLADERHVKLIVTRYYDTQAAQDYCQLHDELDPDADPEPISGHIGIRWAFVE